MLRHISAVMLIVLGTVIISLTLGGTRARGADNDNPTLLDRLDKFGQNIFGGLFPTDKGDAEESHPKPKPKPQRRALLDLDESSAESSHAPARAARAESSNTDRLYYRTPTRRTSEEQPSAARRPVADAEEKPAVREEPQRELPAPPVADRPSTAEQATEPAAPVRRAVVRSTPTAAPERVDAVGATPTMQPLPAPPSQAAEPAAQSSSSSIHALPLHQRMSLLRQSPFGEAKPAVSATPPSPAATVQPSVAAEAPPTVVRPAPLTVSPAETRRSDAPNTSSLPAPAKSEPVQVRAASRPVNVMPPPVTVGSALVESSNTTPLTPAVPSASVQPAPSRSESGGGIVNLPRTAMAAAGSTGNMLLTRQSPNLRVETVGPRRISVGKESSYEITVLNSGEVAAEELVVTVDLPVWADVRGNEAGQGRAEMVAAAGGGRQLQWRVGRLDAQGRQRIVVRIVPRESKPFDLAVKCDFRQSASQAAIEVQEPKLVVNVEGPREVLFGKKELYRIKVANSGTGDAENVLLKLWPVGAGSAAVSQALGNLAPGEQRLIEAELTARQVGNMTMKVEALCDGNIRAEVAEPVAVLRAGLQLQADGSQHQFVGTTGAYRVRVVNPGTAPARGVTLQATLPADVKCVSASNDGQIEQSGGVVRWKLGALPPGADRIVELKCLLGRAGDLRLEVSASAEDDLSAVAAARTQVEAMADLTLQVVDPQGAVAVGDDAVYDLRVRNRGSMSAEGVEVAAFFSQGIEPVLVEGGPHRISVGQVTFSPIATLPAGKEVQLRIVARAQTAGTHIFRAEVHCRPLGVRLANEETTRFYLLQNGAGVIADTPAAVPQTADRRNVPAQQPAPSTAQPSLPLQR